MHQTLQNFIKEVLTEDKSKEVLGQRFSPISLYKDKVVSDKDKEHCQIFFTMTKLPKIGINVMSPIDKSTPTGIYAYPLINRCWKELLDNDLPYASESPYVSFIKMTQPDKCLILSDTIQSYRQYREFKKDLHGGNDESDGFIMIRKNALQAGYTSIYDPGMGRLHENEPFQAVFLTADSYKVLSTHETSEFRRYTDDVKKYKLHSNYIYHLSQSSRLKDNQVKFVLKHGTVDDILRFYSQRYWDIFISVDWQMLFEKIKDNKTAILKFSSVCNNIFYTDDSNHDLIHKTNLMLHQVLNQIPILYKDYDKNSKSDYVYEEMLICLRGLIGNPKVTDDNIALIQALMQ